MTLSSFSLLEPGDWAGGGDFFRGQPVSVLRALAITGDAATLFDEVLTHVLGKHLFTSVYGERVLALAPKP